MNVNLRAVTVGGWCQAFILVHLMVRAGREKRRQSMTWRSGTEMQS